MKDYNYYIYIMTNKYNNVLYTAVTNNLVRRYYEHKNHIMKGFTSKYKVTKLVYFEYTQEIRSAIEREKQIKGMSHSKKVNLIVINNPYWKDLGDSSLGFASL